MNTKDNQRTRLSKLLFKNALMDMLREKKSVDKISVRELCERAELNRSTFYAHYNEPKDLLNEIENDLLNATADHLKKIGEENDAGAHTYILSFLKYIRENDKQFRTLLVDSADSEFRTKFIQISIMQIIENLDFTLPEDFEQYVYSFILNGSAGVIVQWIRSGYSIDENKLVELLFTLNKDSLTYIAMP